MNTCKKGLIACLFFLTSLGAAQACHNETVSRYQLKIFNKSGQSVQYFYASPVGQGSWGPDLLGSGVMRHGECQIANLPQSCTYDFKAKLADGSERFKWNMNICYYSLLNVE